MFAHLESVSFCMRMALQKVCIMPIVIMNIGISFIKAILDGSYMRLDPIKRRGE